MLVLALDLIAVVGGRTGGRGFGFGFGCGCGWVERGGKEYVCVCVWV